MEIGTKKWHESLSDMGWEVLALAGMLLQASVLAIIIWRRIRFEPSELGADGPVGNARKPEVQTAPA